MAFMSGLARKKWGESTLQLGARAFPTISPNGALPNEVVVHLSALSSENFLGMISDYWAQFLGSRACFSMDLVN